MVTSNLNKPVNYTDILKIIDDIKKDFDKLLMEFYSNNYITYFTDKQLRKFQILEKLYQQILKEPRFDWLIMEKNLEIQHRLDPYCGGVIFDLSFANSQYLNKHYVKGLINKRV